MNEKAPNDEYISFEKTNYRNPYNNRHVLEMEDIFGYMLTYKQPLSLGDAGYLIRKKKDLHTEVCKSCIRLPEFRQYQTDQDKRLVTRKLMIPEESREAKEPIYELEARLLPSTCDGCRVMKLKQAVNDTIAKIRWDNHWILQQKYLRKAKAEEEARFKVEKPPARIARIPSIRTRG